MRKYNKSDYAKNKISLDIVYDGAKDINKVTIEDFLKENPNLTEFDFEKYKCISDEIYKEIDRGDTNYTNHKISLDKLNDKSLLNLIENKNETNYLKICLKSNILTKKQKRRIEMYCIQKLSYTEIAKIEKVSVQAIDYCMNLIGEKVIKLIKNIEEWGLIYLTFKTNFYSQNELYVSSYLN